MEIQTTEASENSTSLPVTTTETETTETLDQMTPPVVEEHPQPTETSDQPPPPVTTMPETETATETSLPEVTNTETPESVEVTTLPEVTNTHSTEPSEDSTLPPVTNTQTTEETIDQPTLPPLTDIKSTETIEQTVIPPVVTDNSHDDNLVATPENHQVIVMRLETPEEEEEVRNILKDIAATGKFSHDWEKFRSMLSLHLKQVISEYPQAKMTIEEQKSSLGETYAELVKRLDDALVSFVDGPPFTLQRLSEIILDAKSLYPNLSKLALALEKNLSVTSTLTMSTDPFPPSLTPPPNGLDQVTVDPNPGPNPDPSLNPEVESDAVMENGAQAVDGDEIMTEVEADVSEVMTMEVETYEKPLEESSPMTTSDS